MPNNSLFRGKVVIDGTKHSPNVPRLRRIVNFLISLSTSTDAISIMKYHIMSSSERKSSMTCGPWKLLRLVLRIVFFSVVAWFILALLWAFLPAPLRDSDPDNGSIYATSRLRAGNTLTRVYE